MRLALISDIHGNNVALEAVLTAISTQNITQVICLGDVASTGPQPCEVIKRLREIGCPVVMGNMDVWLLQPAHCLTKIFLSPLQASLFLRLCPGLSSKTASSLINSEAGEAYGLR